MTSSQTSLSKSTFPSLTGLRTIAAALVFFFHWFFSHASDLPLLIRAPFDIGYVGVPIFFALSGFLITLRYGHRFVDLVNWDWNSYGRYYLRRIIRIVPLYLIVLCGFVFAFGRPENMMPADGRQTVILLTLAQALYRDTLLLGTTVGWTLTIEMAYYAVAPLLVRFTGMTSTWPALTVRTLLLLGTGLLIAYGLSQIPTGTHPLPLLAGEPINLIVHYSLFGQLGAFLFGQVAAIVFLNERYRDALRPFASRLVVVATLTIYGTMVWLASDDGELGSLSNHSLVLLVSLWSSLLILGLALTEAFDQRNMVVRVLGARPMVYLGLISYALYLVQLTEPVQWAYWVGLGVYAGIENQVWRALLLYVVVTGLAAALYELCEKPLHRFLTARLVKRVSG